MKKQILTLVLAAMSLAMMTACDPSCTEECVVKNQSGHDVVVTRYRTIHSGGWNDWRPIADSVQNSVDTIKNGTETKKIGGHIGTTSKKSIEYAMIYNYWNDSVAFVFDDGTIRIFHPECDTSWGPYAFGSDCYTYEDEPNPGHFFHGDILWSRLTYTLSQEDYERCREK